MAAKLTVGAGGAVTLTVKLRVPTPPTPLQVKVKDVLAVRVPVVCDPLVALVPVQPPLAVQLVALVELHVSVEELPLTTEVGLALKVTTGAGVVQLSPGSPLVKLLLGVQVLSDLRRSTLSTLTPAFKPNTLALMLPAESWVVTCGVALASESELTHCH